MGKAVHIFLIPANGHFWITSDFATTSKNYICSYTMLGDPDMDIEKYLLYDDAHTHPGERS
jgi:hypothetical protein